MLAHNLKGKGIWIRRVYECENADIGRMVDHAREAGYTHVLVKTSDGDDPYNIDRSQRDFAAELIPRLRQAGIDVWAWHYVYGDPPPFKDTEKARYWELEAQQAVRRCRALAAMGLQGYVIDAEGEYDRIPDRANKARAFCRILRDGLPDLPIGLASWKWPSYHGPFPWSAFRENIDLDMPQVYWISEHNPVEQLQRSVDEFRRMQPQLPYVAAGPAFFEHNWRPTPDDITAFLRRSLELGLPAANLWAWDHLGLRGGESYNNQNLNFSAEWAAAAAFAWPGA
ncbi:MAG: hypothetical protein HY784_15220, partial [Chloroflexi bacterium]|nr:hypothetical protein [Chloroflexota bacterium]